MTPCKTVTRYADCNTNEENYYVKDDGKFYVGSFPLDPSTGCCYQTYWQNAPNIEGEFCKFGGNGRFFVYRGNCL